MALNLSAISYSYSNGAMINKIRLQFIESGKPVQNAFIERSDGSLRRELLDAYLLYSLQEVRFLT